MVFLTSRLPARQMPEAVRSQKMKGFSPVLGTESYSLAEDVWEDDAVCAGAAVGAAAGAGVVTAGAAVAGAVVS